MALIRDAALAAALLLAGCATSDLATGSLDVGCRPLFQPAGGDVAFSYVIGSAGADPAVVEATVGGAKRRFKPGMIVLTFKEDAGSGVVDSLLGAFGLELVEAGTRKVRTRVRDLAAVKFDAFESDAQAIGWRGLHAFAGRDAAAVHAVAARIMRQGGCYHPLSRAAPEPR